MSERALQDGSPERSTDPAEMDLDWLTLEEGESIRWASTPHRYSVLPAFLVGIPLSIVLVGIPILVASYLQYTNTNYVVTDRGLYSKRGVLSRDVQQIGFDKIQNISYSQSALGSSFGYGSVDISTAGGAGVELQLRNIPDPASVQELITREVDARQQGDSASEKEDVLEEILGELRAIRRAVAGDRDVDDDIVDPDDGTVDAVADATQTEPMETDE
ncbi:PH domain-containing protein [Halorubrum halodurans]|uniref:YdbS-like PH domain-containing protein n=1 Tax=Halorubrum halodurans TaxID=1383851 RepID=A0A256IPB7_9EURY|nr:PH domain-containing protein [Halorubrum halodurans]OYR58409.1 hypothetical protein DJ70_03375 [Halorubrum halodurans]